MVQKLNDDFKRKLFKITLIIIYQRNYRENELIQLHAIVLITLGNK